MLSLRELEMRVAVLSDVHANLHALEAVLRDVDAGDFDQIWFLGDLVGYGPKPNECTEAARTFLDSLQPSAAASGAELFHGSPRDPVWEYVLTDDAAEAAFARTESQLVLVGHSHVALEISDGEDLRGEQATAGTALELGRLRRLLNPGSVGQPRDGDARAAWLEIDNAVGRATFRRTDYPVERTQAEMREVGLPDALAARLAFGI
jgi:diadenosine tetraphosphatase ApaH/serine/threonine PP2A family protein phosphatase